MEYFVISVIFLLFSLAYLFFHKKYQYWSDLGVPQFTPVDFFYGNFKGERIRSIHEIQTNMFLYIRTGKRIPHQRKADGTVFPN